MYRGCQSDESLNCRKRGQGKVSEGLMEKSRLPSSLFRGWLREGGLVTILQGLPGRAPGRSSLSLGIAKNDEKK